jgi:GDP-4-dehydro-6-deoxy-D-mannose reductase
MNVLEAVRRHSPGTGVMLLGSAAEYGVTLPEDLPVRETHPTIPHSFFGDSKLAQTQLGRTAAKLWGLRVISVRPFNVIGPGLPEHYFAAALGAKLRRLSLERGVRTFPLQNSNATRDFVDVRDVVEALVLLTELPASSSGTVFNICTGIETPLLQAARELGQLAGGFVPIPGDDAASRGGTIRSRGDSQLLRECTGWEPRYSWRESLLDMWKSLDALGKAA